MTYELGRAQFILEADGDDLLREQAKVYNETINEARKLTKALAKEIQVRQSDVRNAASVLISDNRKAEQEAAKAARDAAQDRKRTTQELVRYNQQQYKEDLAAWKAVLKERDVTERTLENARKARARAILAEEKAIERERLDNIKRTLAEERTIRERNEKLRRDEARKSAQEERTNNNGFIGRTIRGLPGDLATIAGFGAIASGAIIVREALVRTTDATLKQEEAQRALNAAFGATSVIYKENADQLAANYNRVNSEVEKASTALGTLQRQSNLTGQQIGDLSKIAVDLQAAYGGDLQEAFRSASAAVLGETEALEKYGIVLQDNVLKNSSLLTAEEKRKFTTLSESEKQMIRYRVLVNSAGDATGTAARRANEAQGGFDKLNRSVDQLSLTLGNKTVKETGEFARALGEVIDKLRDTQIEYDKLQTAINQNKNTDPGLAGLDALSGPQRLAALLGYTLVNNSVKERRTENDRAAQYDREIALRRAQQQQEIDDAQKAENTIADIKNTNYRKERERIIAQIEDAARLRQRELDDQIKAANAEKVAKLDALEETNLAEIRNAEDVENARKAAHELELARVNAEKDERQRINAEIKRDTLDRYRLEQKAAEDAAEEQIRTLTIQREQRKRENEETKNNELKRLELEHEALQKARAEEDATITNSNLKRERQAERIHKKNLSRIELEKEKLQEKARDEDHRLELLDEKEEDRHRKELRRIEDRQKKDSEGSDDRIKQIQNEYDAQIEAIKAVQNERERVRRISSLQDKVTEAQSDLRKATGSQDAVAGVAARDKLVRAIRIGDPEAIKKAQQELLEIVGQGDQAIAEAQKKLTEAQQALLDQNVEDNENAQISILEKQRDSQIEQLKNTKNRIEKESDIEKRQEEDRNIRRKRDIERNKEANQEKLRDAVQKLERQQEKENARYDKEKDNIADSIRNNKVALDAKRKEEDIAYERSTEAVRERYEKEQQNITDTFDGEEHGYIPAIKRALDRTKENYSTLTGIEEARYNAEQLAIYNTYDHPEKGILAVMARSEEAARNSYQRVMSNIRDRYEDARQAVERAYNAPDKKSGIIDKLEVMKTETENKLTDVRAAFERSKEGLIGPDGVITKTWKEALEAANKYFDEVAKRGGEIVIPRNVRADRRSENAGDTGSGDQGGGNPGGRGGETPSTVTPATPTNTGIDVGESSDEVNMDPSRFIRRLGFGEKYNGNYFAGPGWEADGNTAAWPSGPTRHKGIDLILPGERNGYGQPIGAFAAGRVVQTHAYTGNPNRDPGGSYVVVQDSSGNTHWYMHLSKFAAGISNKTVRRGDIIGYLGDTGTEDINYPHLHYEVRDGLNNGAMSIAELGKRSINPVPYINGRDAGYLFEHPTMYKDLYTGERGILAERGPERLLGREATYKLDNVIRNTYNASANNRTMYDATSIINGYGVERNMTIGGDTLIYNGVAPDNMIKKWTDHNKDKSLLRGVAGLVK